MVSVIWKITLVELEKAHDGAERRPRQPRINWQECRLAVVIEFFIVFVRQAMGYLQPYLRQTLNVTPVSPLAGDTSLKIAHVSLDMGGSYSPCRLNNPSKEYVKKVDYFMSLFL